LAVARAHLQRIVRSSRIHPIRRSRLAAILLGAALAGGLIVPAKASDPGTLTASAKASAGLAVDRTKGGPEGPDPIALAPSTSANKSVLFGGWVKPQGSQTKQEAAAAMEAKLGRRFALYHYYHGWQNPLIGDVGQWASKQGSTLFINWKAALEWAGGKSNGPGAGYVRWGDIAAGRQDAVIKARANEIKGFKKVVYLNFHHEPEDDRDLPGQRKAGTPAQFVAAWRHIWTVFRKQHVTNVRWVWIMMGTTFKGTLASKWYPGDKYVDVIGDDAYNWFNTNKRSTRWTTFKGAFQAGYAFAETKGKPMWVTEVGVQEDPAHPGRKAQWFRDMGAQIKAWPDITGLIYFMGGENGWWVDSSPSALAAFRKLVRDPYFK